MKAWKFLNKHKWCRGASALSAKGRLVDVTSKSAVSFCLIGAIEAVYRKKAEQAFRPLLEKLGPLMISDWNDNVCKSKRQAVALLKKLDI